MRRGVFIGRFQPFHKGHLEAIKQILGEVDELIVVIGSAQYSHTLDNPFTSGERVEMIRIGLRAIGMDLSRVMTIPLPDIGEHHLWASRLRSFTPRFDVAYTNNPFVKLLLREAGVRVSEPTLHDREELSATNVRRLMIEGGDWRRLLQEEVAEYIESIGGPERMRIIAGIGRPVKEPVYKDR